MRRLVILLLLIPACAVAQSGAWGLRGITRRLMVRGNFVFDVDGRGVAAYDVTTLRRVDAAETASESLDGAFAGDTLVVLTRNGFERFAIAGDGTLAFLGSQPAPPATRIAANGELVAAAGDDGIRIYRSEPNGLTLAGVWLQTHRITSLVWRGSALFAAVDSVGVPVIDGATSAQIGYVGENAIDIAIDGDLLYCASGKDGLAIYDVRDLDAPHLVSRTAAGEGYFHLVAAASGRAVTAEESKSVQVFDVSVPAQPRAFPPFAQTVEAIAASGSRLLVSGSMFDDWNVETGSGIPIREYDLTQPDTPRVVAEAHDLAGPVNGAATDGTLAYVSDPPYFRVIDVSTTASPREIASLRIDDIEPFVKSLDTRVILYGTGHVQFIDVSNPYRPKLVGVFASFGHPPSAAAITRNAFIEGNNSSGFHVFDFFADGSPRFIAGIKTHPVDIVARGDAAYYIVEFLTVGVADVSAGARPVKPILITALQLALAKDLLLIRDPRTMHVFSLADPLDPVEVSAVPLDRGGVIAADDNAAYIAANGGVVRMDLTNPAFPLFQPTGMRVVAPSQIAAANGKVVVADRYALRIYGPNSAPPRPPAPVRRRASRP